MKISWLVGLLLLFIFCPFAVFTQNEDKIYSCSQNKAEKTQLISKAESNQLHIREITFYGNTFTRYRTFRENMADFFNEGYIFSQKNLTKSIKGINKIKSIRPISLDNIEVLIKKDETSGIDVIDFNICIQEINRFLTEEEKQQLNQNIEEAEKNQYIVRYVEIVGNEKTSGRNFFLKMALGEMDVFTRKALEKSIANVNTIKQIYPIKLENIEIRLYKDTKRIDLIFNVVERKK